ncbi:MAG: DNA-3-methyladenine glycosylase, partial [Planctomycetota bacterium]
AVPRSLPRHFYRRHTVDVARDLLGCEIWVRHAGESPRRGRIVEVEAYRGPEDRAAHSAGGRRTPRNEVMWGPEGRLYVYFVYGMHHCANVVAAREGIPEAVLLRALEPLEGVEIMRRRRRRKVPAEHLLRGPACLCKGMGIDRRHNGTVLSRGPLRILDAPAIPAGRIARTPRIGVGYAGEHASRPWRFFVRGNVSVSGPVSKNLPARPSGKRQPS